MSNQSKDYGSVEGVLELRIHGPAKLFRLHDDLNQGVVDCGVPDNLVEPMRRASGYRISAWGPLHYHGGSEYPMMIAVEGFRMLEEKKPPEISEIVGILLE